MVRVEVLLLKGFTHSRPRLFLPSQPSVDVGLGQIGFPKSPTFSGDVVHIGLSFRPKAITLDD